MTAILDPHQVEGVKFIRRCKGQAGLFARPGTGKTLMFIRYAGSFDLVLMICRPDDIPTWREALASEEIPANKVFVLRKEEQCAELVNSVGSWSNDPVTWVITTYEAFLNFNIKKTIRGIAFDCVGADEFDKLQNIKAQRTKAVIEATRHIPRRIGMSGTPFGNDPDAAFALSLFIDDGKTFGKKEWDFRMKFYLRHPAGGFVIRQGAKKLIANLMAPFCYYVHEDQVLKLPPVKEETILVEMTGKQRRFYDDLLHNWEIELQAGQSFEVDHIVSKIEKLLQIANGFVKDPTGKAIFLGSRKYEAFSKLLASDERCKGKVVAWCRHTASIGYLHAHLLGEGITSVKFSGSNRDKKWQARKAFRDDPGTRVFIGQADAGVGMNELIIAKTAIYMSNSTRGRSRTQSMARTRRRGSELHDSCHYIDIVTRGTIEEKGRKDLEDVMAMAIGLLNSIKQGQDLRTALS